MFDSSGDNIDNEQATMPINSVFLILQVNYDLQNMFYIYESLKYYSYAPCAPFIKVTKSFFLQK